MSDFSGYFQISFQALDGTTQINSVVWGPNPPTQYRAGTVEGALGRIPVNAFTRADGEGNVNQPPQPVAREGSLVIARLVATSVNTTAEIGVLPAGGVIPTQRQRLSADLVTKLWTFPGDELWLFDPNPLRARVDLFLRGLNFRDLDALTELPQSQPEGLTTETYDVGNVPNLPAARAFRNIYVLTPPAVDHVFNLPAALTTIGADMIVVNPSQLRCRIQAATPFLNQPAAHVYSLGPRMAAHFVSYGEYYAELGFLGHGFELIGVATNFGPWRGLKQVRFTGNAAFNLPQVATVSPESVMLAFNGSGGAISVTAAAGETINNAASISIAVNEAVLIRPHTPTAWVAV